MQSNQYLIDLYSNYDEEKRLLLRHGSIEFLATMHYIKRYVAPDNHILEVGAGTGRYSHTLARQSYAIDAVELVEHNIEIFRKNTQPGENITIARDNATSLSAFPDNTYGITLISEPLYHLYNVTDKRQALREMVHVTKSGGIIFIAYVISGGCLLDEGLVHGNINVAKYVKNGLLNSKALAVKFKPESLFELVRKEDIDHIMSILSMNRLHYVMTDGTTLSIRSAMDKVNQDIFGLYLKYRFVVCERIGSIGITSHAIDIFRKPT